jgi:hypothetical protein
MEKAMDKGRLARMLGTGLIIAGIGIGVSYLTKEVKSLFEKPTSYQTSITSEYNSSSDLREE